MKLELERSEFLKAWQTAEKYTPSKTTMDALNGICITANEDNSVTLEATDLKSSVKCSAKGAVVIEPGVAVLNASIFGNMLRKSKANTITLEIGSEKGTLKADKSKSRFTVIPADSFPKLPESSEAESFCRILAKSLSDLISEGSCAASTPSDFPKYMGTCLLRIAEQNIIAVSTDGKRLARTQTICEAADGQGDLLLPSQALKELGKIFSGENPVSILADDSTVWFKIDDAEFSIRKIDASFPKYERILNNEVKTSAKIDKNKLLSALDRIDVIAKNNPAHIMAMNLNPESGEVKITARAQELGTITEVLDAEITGEPMQIGFNVTFFQDGIKAVSSEIVMLEFSDVEGQTRIYKNESDDFLYMLMPIRLTPQDIVSDDDADEFSAPVQPEDLQENHEEPQDNQDNHEFDDVPANDDAPF